jgi:TolB-like protein
MKKLKTAVLTVLLIALSTSVFAAAKTVAIVPFKVNAEKDMSFLRDGVYDMLSTRLSREGEVEVLNRQTVEKALPATAGPLTEAAGRELGRKLAADFVLFGSLTVLGNSISMDSKMVDVAGAKPALSFFEQSDDAGGIISKVNAMAADINQQMFGRAVAARPTAPAGAAQPGQPPAPGQPAPFDPFAHPEKMFKQGTVMGGKDSPFVSEDSSREVSPQFWKGASFKENFNGIALGDVDGDGQTETLLITPNQLLILRYAQQRMQKVYETPESQWDFYISLDVADINGNGRPEIFITSFALGRQSLQSFVLEFDGKSYNRIATEMSYYLRVVSIPGRGPVLLGQKHVLGDPYSKTMSEMIWRGDRYEPEAPLTAVGNVLGVAIGDIINDGTESVAAYDSGDHIRVISASDKNLWKSSEKYGGNTIYSEHKVPYDEIRHFLPIRLMALKSPKDGKTSVLAVKNHDFANMKLKNYRSFNEAQVILFAWDGLGLAPQWKTRKLSGFIRDFAVGDFNNDGKKDLVCAVVQEEGLVVGSTPKSTLVALEFAE